MTLDLNGRVAAITGGGSGLGAAMAGVFSDAGAAVACLDLDGDRARAVAADLESRGRRAIGLTVDVGDADSVGAAARVVQEQLGGCHLLAANVGVQQFGAVDKLTEQDWEWILGVNVLGTVRSVNAFLPLLRRDSGFRRIVITSSSSALLAGVRLSAYISSKFAVTGYGDVLRAELSEEGIGVTVMFPAGMHSRHVETSRAAKPAEVGEWTLDQSDVDAMMASRKIDTSTHVATPEHAIRDLLPALEEDRPYLITHGAYRAQWRERIALLELAFDAMESS